MDEGARGICRTSNWTLISDALRKECDSCTVAYGVSKEKKKMTEKETFYKTQRERESCQNINYLREFVQNTNTAKLAEKKKEKVREVKKQTRWKKKKKGEGKKNI